MVAVLAGAVVAVLLWLLRLQIFGETGAMARRLRLSAMGTWGGGRVVGHDSFALTGPERAGVRSQRTVYAANPSLQVATEMLKYRFRIPAGAMRGAGAMEYVDVRVAEGSRLLLLVHSLTVRSLAPSSSSTSASSSSHHRGGGG
jgi:hypothetical protein